MDLNLLNSEDDLKIDFDLPKPMCRCCLTSDRRMNDVMQYDGYFKELAGINVMQSDGLPQWICWECGSLLQKAVRFKLKMLRAHDVLYKYSARCAPFPIDAHDPELSEYASPHLSVTGTLVLDTNAPGHEGFHGLLQHEKLLHKTYFDIEALPIDTKVDDLVKEEVDFGVDYDDDITLEEYRTTQKLTEEDIKQLLEDTSALEPKEEPVVKRKKKSKKKDEKIKKKKKKTIEEIIEAEEPKSTIRKAVELDPTKIRVITLNPQEQIKQREEESKTGFVFPYPCHLCYKGFNYENKLENHMKKHSPSRGTFECKLCHVFLPTAYSFGVHNLIHTRRYECMECGRRMIDRASILDHYRSQHEGFMDTYKCEICGKISTNNKTHRGHMRNHHSGERPKCDQCGKSFVNNDARAEHMLIHQDAAKNYECPTCGKRFRTRAQIKVHQLKHTDSKDYYCVECDVRFKSAHSLRQHLKKSMKHKDCTNFQYGCNRCEKRYETEEALRSHTLIQHEGVRSYRCGQCPAALASTSSLQKHVHSVHRGLRPPPRHVCDTCGKAFRGKSVLTNHVRTHTGEKPFVCTQCGRGFSQRTAMRTHMKLVHLKIRKRTKIEPEPPKPMESKEQVFPKQEWSRPPPPCDLFFHVAA